MARPQKLFIYLGGITISRPYTLYVDERQIGVAPANINFNLEETVLRPGVVTYLYLGHTIIDIDQVAVEPTLGFRIQSSLLAGMREEGDATKPVLITTTSWIEVNSELGYLRGTKGDNILIANLDAQAYRCLIKIVVREDE